MSAWGRYSDSERVQWRSEYERTLALGYPWQTAENVAHTLIMKQQMAAHTASLIGRTEAMLRNAS